MEEAAEMLDKIIRESNYDLTSDDVVQASQVLDTFIVKLQKELNARKSN